MLKKIFILLIVFVPSVLYAGQIGLLRNSVTKEQLYDCLVLNDSWVEYPGYKDRKSWERLILPGIRENIIKAGEEALSYQWKPDLATDYLAYKRNGSILTGRNNQMTLNTLVLAELVEGKGRFIDAIINGAWFLCEVSWVHSAHAYFQKDQSGLPDPKEPTVELVVADIGAQMAWIYYFFHDEFDKISPLISKRIKDTVYERLIVPYYIRDDYWWMGFSGKSVNNWNIWINYNVLQAVLLLEKDKVKRVDYIYKLIRSVDFFIDGQHQDGSCDEGPSYFGHAGANLVKFLGILDRATNGYINIFDDEKIQNIGKYISRVHINKQYFVNFSDASARCYVSPGAIFHYGKMINDSELMVFAADFARENDWINVLHKGSLFARILDDVLMAKEILETKGTLIQEKSFYFPEGELATVREYKQCDKGFYFAAHGSNNGVPHNHNDVGSFMLYYDGEPVLIDVGVGVYRKETFSSKRYSIWSMQSRYHNLPTINGLDQHHGNEYSAENTAFIDKGKIALFRTNISNAYVKDAGIMDWIRSYELVRGQKFVICDEWKLNKIIGESALNFITKYQPVVCDGGIELNSGKNRLHFKYDSSDFDLRIEKINLTDKKLINSWETDRLYRIKLIYKGMKLHGSSKITIRPVM